MSTILKALKKLEEEQRAAAPQPLAGKVLTTVAVPKRRARPLWLVVAGVAGGLLLAVLAGTGYLWMRDTPRGSGAMVAPTSVVPSVAPSPAILPESPATVPADLPARVAQAIGASPPGVVAAPPAPNPPPQPAPGKAAVDPIPAPAPPAEAVEEVAVASRVIPAPGQQWTVTRLQVTEIFPGTGNERMAMVNGLPVMAGTWVEDALVKEIRAAQVVFEIDGKSVVVPLSPSP